MVHADRLLTRLQRQHPKQHPKPSAPPPTDPGFEDICRTNLVAVAKAYAKAADLALSTVSKKFHGKHTFFEQFERGEVSLTLPKVDEMLEAFGAAWPEGTPRPPLRPAFMRLGKSVPAT